MFRIVGTGDVRLTTSAAEQMRGPEMYAEMYVQMRYKMAYRAIHAQVRSGGDV